MAVPAHIAAWPLLACRKHELLRISEVFSVVPPAKALDVDEDDILHSPVLVWAALRDMGQWVANMPTVPATD